MNYKITVLLLSLLCFSGCFSMRKYYSDDNGEICFTEGTEDVYYLLIYYPEYAVKKSSLLFPGSEKYFQYLEEKFYYQISFGVKNNFKLKNLEITIINENNGKIISENGIMDYYNQTNIYNNLKEYPINNLLKDNMLHVYFIKDKFSNVDTILLKCKIIVERDKEIKQFEFSKKLHSKSEIITPLYFYH